MKLFERIYKKVQLVLKSAAKIFRFQANPDIHLTFLIPDASYLHDHIEDIIGHIVELEKKGYTIRSIGGLRKTKF